MPGALDTHRAPRRSGALGLAGLLLLAATPLARADPARGLLSVYEAKSEAALHEIVERGAPLAADHARAALADRALARGDLARTAEHLAELGLPEAAVVLAPDGPQPWPGRNRRGRLEVSAALDVRAEGRLRLGFALVADRPTRAVLRVGAPGPIRVDVDGARLLEREVAGSGGLEQAALPLLLPRGRHRLTVELEWQSWPAELAVRLTAPRGGAHPHARLLGAPPAVEAPAPRPARRGRFRFSRVEDGLAALPPGPRARLERALGLDARPEQTAEGLRSAAKTARGAAAASWWRALAAHHRSEGALERALTADRRALGAHPDDDWALLGLAETSWALERPLDALGYLRALGPAAARGPELAAAAASLRAQLGVHHLSEGAAALVPLERGAAHAATLAARRTALETQLELSTVLGAPEGIRAAARRLIALDRGHREAHRALVAEALLSESATAAADLAAEAARAFPMKASLQHMALRIRSETEAEEALAAARAMWPRFFGRVEHALLIADLAAIAGVPAVEREAMGRARRLAPSDPRVDAASAPRGEADVFAEHRLAPSEVLASGPVAGEAAAGASALARRVLVEAEADGRFAREVHVFFRLSDARARPRLETHRVPYVPSRESVDVLAARRWRSGQPREAELVEDVGLERAVDRMILDQRAVEIRFSELEPGDVVELHLVVRGAEAGIFGAFLGEVLVWQDDLPQANFRHVVSLPSTLEATTWTRGLPPPEKKISGSRAVWTWTSAGLPRLPSEPAGPPPSELGAVSAVSAFSDWGELGAWYAERWRERLTLDAAARGEADRLVRGASSPAERLRALHRAVVRRTRYLGLELGLRGFIPDPAPEVLRRGWGDCKDQSTLLAAWLRAVGVEAELALVRTAPLGPLPAEAVTLWSFDHALLYVPSLDLYVDPTEPFAPPGSLPPPDLGAEALVVSASGGSRRVRLPDPGPSAHVLVESATVTLGPGPVEVAAELRASGALAPPLRARLEVEDRRRDRFREELDPGWGALRLGALEVSDPRDLERPLRVRWRGRGRLERLPLAFSPSRWVERLTPLTERRTALRLPHPRVHRLRLAVRARGPAPAPPAPLEVRGPGLAYRRRVEPTATGWIVEDELTLSGDRVRPEDYPALRRAAAAIDRARSQTVPLARPSARVR